MTFDLDEGGFILGFEVLNASAGHLASS
nr:DUF2283 domain-containing protein [Corynebacterium yudongzhengii]